MTIPALPNLHCGRHQAPYPFRYIQQGRRCVLKKHNDLRPGKFGSPVKDVQIVPCINGQPVVLPAGAWACSNPQTDPYEIPPHQPPTSIINCLRHQAPAGYEYRLIAGHCILFRKGSNTPVVVTNPVGTILQTPATTVTHTLSNVTNWIQNNKLLALALGTGAYYFYTKKK